MKQQIDFTKKVISLPEGMTGKELKKELDMNGVMFISPRPNPKVQRSLKKAIHMSILNQKVKDYVDSTKKENEVNSFNILS